MDGWLTIGTKIDDSKFDKQLNALEKRYSNKEIDIDITSKELNEAEAKLNEINKMLDRRIDRENQVKAKLAEEMSQQYKSKTLIETYQAELSSITDEQLKLYDAWEKQNMAVDKLTSKLDKQKNDLNDIGSKIAYIKNQKIETNVNSIGKSLNGVVKKVAKWGLAVFGIRSAYNFVRQSISTLAGENEQLASDVEYIRYALASTLQPVIERLIQLVYKLLQYVNYLARAWFGVNIFANANAKAMNKAVGSAKQLNKQLAGFDEMNVLSDTGAGAGGAGATPSVDLTQMQGDVPEWIKWLGANGEVIIAILGGIATGIIAIKLGADLLLGLGIGIAIAGLILLIQDVIKFIQDPSWEGFINILRDLAIVLAGVAIAMIAFNATNPIGWIMLAISAIALLVTAIIKNWDKVKAFFKSAVDWIKTTFNTVITFFSNLISKIVGLFKNIGTKVADVLGGAFKGVINGVLSAIESILNFPIRQVNKLLDIINKVPGINISKLSTFSLPRLAKGGIVNMPGRGVPIGGAIAGEAGREAVLPLQDNQVLDEIADAIGRRIVLQPTIPVYVGGRQVSRVTRKIDAEEKFAYNE